MLVRPHDRGVHRDHRPVHRPDRVIVDLDMSHCVRLRARPATLGGLHNLQELDLGSCPALEALPEAVGELQGLRHLNLARSASLRALPKSLGHL